MRLLGALFFFIFLSTICYSDEIILKSGQQVEGKIIDQTKDSVKLDYNGTTVTYYSDEIEKTIKSAPLPAPQAPVTETSQSTDTAQPNEDQDISQQAADDVPGNMVIQNSPSLEYTPDFCKSGFLDDPVYVLYVPTKLDCNTRHPLAIVLFPVASAQKTLTDTWVKVAEKFKWVLLVSKKFHNGIPDGPILKELVDIINANQFPVQIDQSKIVASGFSGGAMGSHSLSFEYPQLISGIILNTGMMGDDTTGQKDKYPHDKLAVFLASPTDFRYKEMHRDRDFLENVGWKTQWIEFKGGHRVAPPDTYFAAVQWMTDQWGGSGN